MLPAPVPLLAPVPDPRLPAPAGPAAAGGPPLPARPRLRRPALHRAPGVLQFGLDPAAALVADGLTPPLARMVDGLDGSRPLARVLADAAADGASPRAACGLLERLHGVGLLVDADFPHAPDRSGHWVVVRGAGRLGVTVACVLAAAGVGRVLVDAAGTVGRDDVGTGLLPGDVGRPAALAAEEAVARATGVTLPARARARRWLAARADLVVLAEGPRPDPVVAAALTAEGRAHLPAAVVDGVGTVGPLVVPGRTPCLRCDDLARADADPAWPRLAAELATLRPPVAVVAAVVVAAVAAEQALALLDGAPVDARGAVLDVGADGHRRPHVLRRHPACGCDALAARPAAGGPRGAAA